MVIARDETALSPFFGGVFVPTMGALHEGHAALIRHARQIADASPAPRPAVVVSLFVNPTQFNDPRDFERYPRTEQADAALCAAAGADAVYIPRVDEVYPRGLGATDGPGGEVALPRVATAPGLEDAHRPGHFAGVCRVVRRLFELVDCRIAVFGEKDWQQLQVVRAMSQQLNLRVQIVPHQTIRESSGLAMSSRNARLSPEGVARAAAVWRAMHEAGRVPQPERAEAAGIAVLRESGLEPEYVAVRDAQTLEAVRPGLPARILVAARLEGVRLIDNAPWPDA